MTKDGGSLCMGECSSYDPVRGKGLPDGPCPGMAEAGIRNGLVIYNNIIPSILLLH